MRFIVISERGMFLPLAEVLQQEGAEVFVYVHDRSRRDLYEGVIKERIASPKDLVGLLDPREEATFIVDGYFPNTGKPEDKELYAARGLKAEVQDLIHPLFTDPRQHRVIGAGANVHSVHASRPRQLRLMSDVGLEVPFHQACEGLRSARAFLEEHRDRKFGIYLEAEAHAQFGRYDETFPGELAEYLGVSAVGIGDGPITVEEQIDGIEAYEEVWWEDGRPLVMFSTVEQTRIGAKDIGWHCGSMLGLTWRRPVSTSFTPWDKCKRFLRAPYTGPVAARYTVPSGGRPIFRGFHIGFRYDSAFAIDTLRTGYLSKLLTGDGSGYEDEWIAASVRALGAGISGAPIMGTLEYPYWIAMREGQRGPATSRSAGPVLVATHSESIDEGPELVFQRAIQRIQEARVVGGLYYRTDYSEVCDAWRRLCRMGWS